MFRFYGQPPSMPLPVKPALILLLHLTVTIAVEPAIQPSLDQARLNAFPIFNAIHSATRLWGSSLNHNGVAMIPATVPQGTLLYHGTHFEDPSQPAGFEWLAFQPEHSEPFGYSWHSAPRGSKRGMVAEQRPLTEEEDNGDIKGYLRTYLTARPLSLLYLDGMSAAKGCLGPMDTADLVLRLLNRTTTCDTTMPDIMAQEVVRLAELCAFLQPLGYDGVLRMEAGFEVAYCAFDDGKLRLLDGGTERKGNGVRRRFWKDVEGWYTIPRMVVHFARAAGQHYGGMGGRVRLDFGGMVSGYWYHVDLTNPDAEDGENVPGLMREGREQPRLLRATHAERAALRDRVRAVALAKRDGVSSPSGIEWQGVVDAVVGRWADRLALLAALEPGKRFAAEVFVATDTYVDVDEVNDDDDATGLAAARGRCQRHYLQPVEPARAKFTLEEGLIYATIEEVTGRICETIFDVRAALEKLYRSRLTSQFYGDEATDMLIARVAETGQERIRALMRELQWTVWEKCGACAIDEVCFVPMFPFGSVEDGRRGPSCLNESGIDVGLDLEKNYWKIDARGALKMLTTGS